MTVIVSAHLDDAVLSCYHALGPGTTVLTVLAGAPATAQPGWWDLENGVADSRARMRERRQEDGEALALSGSALVHLDGLDSQYAQLPEPAAIATLLEPYVASARQVLAPAGIWNLDHKVVRDAVLAVRADAVLYADLPYALHPDSGGFALPAEVEGDRTAVEYVLDEETIAEKLEAVSRYRTQLDQLVLAFGDFLDQTGLGREVTWLPRPHTNDMTAVT